MKSNQTHATRPAAPAPSVPISVYRELAAELQATRAMIDALNGRNQQLDRENQHIRQDIQRVMQATLSLQPWIEGQPSLGSTPPRGAARPTWEESATASAIAASLRPEPPETWATEEAALPQAATQAPKAGRLNSLWLILTVMAIIVTAFGAGFLIMRPFLPTGSK
jgi:hypothetical protein